MIARLAIAATSAAPGSLRRIARAADASSTASAISFGPGFAATLFDQAVSEAVVARDQRAHQSLRPAQALRGAEQNQSISLQFGDHDTTAVKSKRLFRLRRQGHRSGLLDSQPKQAVADKRRFAPPRGRVLHAGSMGSGGRLQGSRLRSAETFVFGQYVADVLVTLAEKAGDFGAFVACRRQRTDLVGHGAVGRGDAAHFLVRRHGDLLLMRSTYMIGG